MMGVKNMKGRYGFERDLWGNTISQKILSSYRRRWAFKVPAKDLVVWHFIPRSSRLMVTIEKVVSKNKLFLFLWHTENETGLRAYGLSPTVQWQPPGGEITKKDDWCPQKLAWLSFVQRWVWRVPACDETGDDTCWDLLGREDLVAWWGMDITQLSVFTGGFYMLGSS